MSDELTANMFWHIEIKPKAGVFDALGAGIQKDIEDLGILSVRRVEVSPVYILEGNLSKEDAAWISSELLTDPVTQEYSFFVPGEIPPISSAPRREMTAVEIAYNPGVMDPVEGSTLKGIRDLGISSIRSVRTARKYFLHGKISEQEKDVIVNKVLCNKLIQHVVAGAQDEALSLPAKKGRHGLPAGTVPARGRHVRLLLVDLLKAGGRKLKSLSREGQLFLNLKEMQAIRQYFRKIGRNPTDCELETIAQTWSEHCFHKTFKSDIRYTAWSSGRWRSRIIRNLFKSTVVKATQEINKPWCVSVFHDNAGVIKFDQEDHVCFKVETHNHPSALEPFGGANTGIGGVIRDILGTGLGAKPICSTDIFCFARPDTPFEKLPAGTLHPKRVMKGVVSGVRDYGNKMGIPTVNGAICFDERFVGNPLVFCGSVGLIPKDCVRKKIRKGDLIVAIGGRTGRDGIHGATFSSGELTGESETVSSGAVQIGNPIEEKKVLDALMQARDRKLYTAITDCGAGGFSSAVGEMGKELGARVHLEKAPLKYAGLTYTEIWISESQERMVLAVSPDKKEDLLKVFWDEDVEAVVIGEFTGTGRLELFYEDVQVCDLDMEFLHDGIPKMVREARWQAPKLKEPRVPVPKDLTQTLKNVLGHLNVCSKEWVIRQYDHEVQGASVIKPLVGLEADGPSDASVIAPKLGSKKGIAIANGINPRYGEIDPFWMAASCVDEAVRQIVAVGGNPDRVAILDNFCWGNPDKPDRLGSLVRCAEGCTKAAVGYGTPFISGKDSLYNEYTLNKKSIAIPGTILISAIGIIEDTAKTITMDLKHPGNLIYIVGETREELGGSIYFDTLDLLGNSVPKVDVKQGLKIFRSLFKAARKGWIQSMHDCSEGGLGAALAEMAFSGGLGAEVSLDRVPRRGSILRDDFVLFSESNSRLMVEVSPENQKEFEKSLKGSPFACLGRVEKSSQLVIHGLDRHVCVEADIGDLKKAWQRPLRW